MSRIKMKKVYREIAKDYGVSAAEVRREIQAAVADAFYSRESEETAGAWDGIQCKGDVPTPEEFILFAAEKIRDKI